MKITFAQIAATAKSTPNRANAEAIVVSLNTYGAKFGMLQPHRLAQFLAQVMHESNDFRYDEEIWGPTPAQKRYDTRTDLGNSPERDGDGFLYRGRTGMQTTGKDNYGEFRDWCAKNIGGNVPDFVKEPDKINTDPWEGLSPIWYWTTRKLNKYADEGDIEMITKRINGGLNGYADRLDRYDRVALVFLGHRTLDPSTLAEFQAEAKARGLYSGKVDGVAGPRTRAAMHKALVALTVKSEQSPDVKEGPVVSETPVVPDAIDKPVTQTSGFWERIMQLVGLIGTGGAALLQDWRVVLVVVAALIVVALIGLLLHKRLIDAARNLKEVFGK